MIRWRWRKCIFSRIVRKERRSSWIVSSTLWCKLKQETRGGGGKKIKKWTATKQQIITVNIPLSFLLSTSCCFFLPVNFNFIIKLAVQPGVARAFALRSTLSLRSCGSAQLCRFALAGCAQLCRFVPVLRSCAQLCRFAVVRSASSPPDRLLNPQKTPLRNFVFRWNSAGLKTYTGRFWNCKT